MARRTATTKTEREVKVTSRMTTGSADAAPESEGKGMGYADAIILVTTVLLLAAFFMTDYLLGHQFGKGMFFK